MVWNEMSYNKYKYNDYFRIDELECIDKYKNLEYNEYSFDLEQ